MGALFVQLFSKVDAAEIPNFARASISALPCSRAAECVAEIILDKNAEITESFGRLTRARYVLLPSSNPSRQSRQVRLLRRPRRQQSPCQLPHNLALR